MLSIIICLLGVITLWSLVSSFSFGGAGVQISSTSSWTKRILAKTPVANTFRHKTWFGMAENAAAADSSSVDFSKFVVGQEYEGTVVSSKKFGVFVDIGLGLNVLLPRSQLSRGGFDKLQKLVDAKSKDKVKLELIGVSETNRTLSGKYISPNNSGFKSRPDLTFLQDKVAGGKLYNATVVSVHDFGIFAEIDEFGIEGLVPASKLPQKLPKGTIQASFPVGTSISVKIDVVNVEAKKLVLSMKSSESTGRGDVSPFLDAPKEKWFQGVVQSVSNFGLFVRPAGYDAVGLVHNSRVPRDLIAALKKIAPIAPGSNKTDVEALFTEGDIIRFRVNSAVTETKKLELNMLPYKNVEDDEEDFASMEAAIAAAGDGDGEVAAPRGKRRDDDVIDSVDEDDDVEYDAQSTLLWWRGAAYKPVREEEGVVLDEEVEVVNESKDVVEGTWRRMFEVDMREDELDFSSKALEAEIKELEEEIGELRGLDDDLIDSIGAGSPFSANKMGSFISLANLPAEWREQLEFFKEVDNSDKSKLSVLKGGKATEKSEFDSLLRTVESDIERRDAAQKASRSRVADVENDIAAAASAAPTAVDAAAPAEV